MADWKPIDAHVRRSRPFLLPFFFFLRRATTLDKVGVSCQCPADLVGFAL